MDGSVRVVSMELIDRPVHVARDVIDMEKVRELAESIREKGLLQPIVLRPVNGRFEVVAGDRRFLAHRFLGLKEIKAVVMELDDTETVEVRAIENVQRENLTPGEQARGYALLAELGGYTAHQIAKKVGKSFATVQSYLRLMEYPEYVRDMVDKRRVSLGVAHVLMEIEEDEFRRHYFEMAAENGISEKVARMWVEDYNRSRNGTYYGEGGGSPGVVGEVEKREVYLTCGLCDGPVRMGEARSVVLCPACRKEIKGAGGV